MFTAGSLAGGKGPRVQHQRFRARVQQMPRKACGIAAVVAAAHKQPDAQTRQPWLVFTQNVKGRSGGIFHQQFFGQAKGHGLRIPFAHFIGQGQGGEQSIK